VTIAAIVQAMNNIVLDELYEFRRHKELANQAMARLSDGDGESLGYLLFGRRIS
jgi:hypothetical protein